MTRTKRIGPMLRLVLATGACLGPFAGPFLNRRLKRGKEDPARVSEKRGIASAERPAGPLIWLHGVGVGEVMALRGLIAQMAETRPDLHFLLTSSARSSGEVIAANLPPRTTHQYLPLDLPRPVQRFLDHWHPDLAVWSDQEVWPRLAVQCTKRGIPQAYVAARITDASAAARARFGRAYADLYGLMDLLHAQDERTATNLQGLIGGEAEVHVTGSLKAAAGAPKRDTAELANLHKAFGTRTIWCLASAHPGDEAVAIEAHEALCQTDPEALLIIAPRNMADGPAIARAMAQDGLNAPLRSAGATPSPSDRYYIADTLGELALWYSLSSAALIGGTFDATEGHNPWEAATLECSILTGPRRANFATDFQQLEEAGGCITVTNAAQVTAALTRSDLPQIAARARKVQSHAAQGLTRITADLLDVLPR